MLRTALKAFVAGVLSTLIFHEIVLWLLSFVLPYPFKPWNMTVNNYGTPAVLALAFWGGIWSIPLCALIRSLPLASALLIGTVLGDLVPTIWSWTVLASMKGRPMFLGGNVGLIATVLFINGVWAFGVVVLFRWMNRPAIVNRRVLA